MPRLRDVLKEAEKLGRIHGTDAATWYFDNAEPKREDYLKVLKGINDGDPEILETFISGSLSGEWAGDMTPVMLYAEVKANSAQIAYAADDICTAYEQAFDSAYSYTVSDICRAELRRTVTFVIDAEVEDQNIPWMLVKMEEIIGKENADLVESKVVDEVGEKIV